MYVCIKRARVEVNGNKRMRDMTADREIKRGNGRSFDGNFKDIAD